MQIGRTRPNPATPSAVRPQPGFTLVELLVVLAIVALMLTIATPRYLNSLETSRETLLMENLRLTREVIDRFYADTGRYPESLSELVERRYLRAVPVDPITGLNDTWIVDPPPHDTDARGSVWNIRSGADGFTREGRAYSEL